MKGPNQLPKSLDYHKREQSTLSLETSPNKKQKTDSDDEDIVILDEFEVTKQNSSLILLDTRITSSEEKQNELDNNHVKSEVVKEEKKAVKTEDLSDLDFELFINSLEESDDWSFPPTFSSSAFPIKDCKVRCEKIQTPKKKIKKEERSVNQKVDSKLIQVLSSFRLPGRVKEEVKRSSEVKKDPPSSPPERVNHNIKQNTGFSQTLKEVSIILESFKKPSGFGSCLKELLPEENKESSDAVAAFLLFVLERQKIWVNKKAGVEPLTGNLVLGSKWFTNMYRELDRGTIYFRKEIIRTTLKGHIISKKISQKLVEEILFKSIIYRLINKVETFMDYGGIPGITSLAKFLLHLKEKKESGTTIFTAAHQNMGLSRLLKTFEYVKKNISSLTSQVISGAHEKSSRKSFKAILTIPNVGDFFAWQILTDLLECRVLGELTDNQWAALGPGAKNGLRRMFPLATTRGELRYTRLVRDLSAPSGPGSGFRALGLQFPAFLDKALSLKNVEHALCEYDKYFRGALGIQIKEREYSRQKSRAGLDSGVRCEVCRGGGGGLVCVLCGSCFHKSCLPSWRGGLHRDGNWLCAECQKYEAAWRTENFSFEEYDESDEVGRAHVSGGQKKAARLRNKKKQKTKEIECIDLSSDEDEDELELDDDDLYGETDSSDDDEVQFVSSLNYGSGSSSDKSEDEEDDPFANIAEWADDEDIEENLEEEDDEILILS